MDSRKSANFFVIGETGTMDQRMAGIAQYLGYLSDLDLQRYAQQVGLSALGNRQVLINQLANALAAQGFEIALAGRGNQAVGLNTAFGGFNQPIIQPARSRSRSRGRSSRRVSPRSLVGFDGRSKPGGNNPLGINQYTPLGGIGVGPILSPRRVSPRRISPRQSQVLVGGQIPTARSAQYGLQDLQALPSFQLGKERAQRSRSPSRRRSPSGVAGIQGLDLRTRPGGNNPTGINQYTENDLVPGRSGSSHRSKKDADAGVFVVQQARTNPLSPTTRKIDQILRNTNDTGYQGAPQTLTGNEGLSLRGLGAQTLVAPVLSPRSLASQRLLAPLAQPVLAQSQSPIVQEAIVNAQSPLQVFPSGRQVGNVAPGLSQALSPRFR